LKLRALRHKRSLNQEVISLLEERTATSRSVSAETIIAKATRFHNSLNMVALPEDIDKFKRQGRP
jgi:hypothetical protein